MEPEVKISTKRSGIKFGNNDPNTEQIDNGTTRKKRWRIKHAEDIKPVAIDWLWYPYLPTGKLTILGGDPGQGKSYISLALAAAGSRGDALPGQDMGEQKQFSSLLIAGEDDLGDTVVPRLKGLRADLRYIGLFDDNFVLDDAGLAGIREMMEESRARLLVIDPIVAFLGEKMDMNRANEVRPRMKKLADIGKDFNAAVLVVRHMRKQPANARSGKAIYNGMGSIDFTAAVRSELQVDEAKDGRKYLNHIKANAGPKGKSIPYTIEDGHFEWGSPVSFPSSNGMLSQVRISTRLINEDSTRRWLFDTLKDKPDGISSSDIMLMGKAAGHSQTRLEHVKRGLVLSVRENNTWMWKLDPQSTYGLEFTNG